MKVSPKIRNLLKQMMIDQKDVLEPMPNAMIQARLVPMMSKQYGYSASEMRQALKYVEVIHINTLRKVLGWERSPKGKAHPNLGITNDNYKNKSQVLKKSASPKPTSAAAAAVVVDIPKTAKSLDEVSNEPQPRFLMVSEDIHKTLKKMMAFVKRAEEREENLLDMEESLRQREEAVRQYQQTIAGQHKVANPVPSSNRNKVSTVN